MKVRRTPSVCQEHISAEELLTSWIVDKHTLPSFIADTLVYKAVFSLELLDHFTIGTRMFARRDVLWLVELVNLSEEREVNVLFQEFQVL
jgi:hypothetical protein